MKVRYEIVDVEGDRLTLEDFAHDVNVPAKVRSIRRDSDEMVITLEYLHGSISCSADTISGGYILKCTGAVLGGKCEKDSQHVVYGADI